MSFGNRIIIYIVNIIISLAILYGLWLLMRVCVFDYFTIPTNSMIPTLKPGDKVIVNKLLMGARIYKNFEFSSKGQELQSFRMKGIRSVKHNDIVVFNVPIHDVRFSFIINNNMCKRVVAVPGDSLSVVDGYYRNNNYNGTLGLKSMQKKLTEIPDSMMYGIVLDAYPFDKNVGWKIKQFGPMYIPRLGDVIYLTAREGVIYRRMMEWELCKKITWDWEKNEVYADGKIIKRHTFKHNYYFCAGDNALDSDDSRYWGLVPEEYIIGIVAKIIHGDK